MLQNERVVIIKMEQNKKPPPLSYGGNDLRTD